MNENECLRWVATFSFRCSPDVMICLSYSGGLKGDGWNAHLTGCKTQMNWCASMLSIRKSHVLCSGFEVGMAGQDAAS
jgi:hypothetical protein